MTQGADKNIEWYLSSFKSFERGLNGESRLPFHALRRNGMERLAELGFPTMKNEEWRFTNIGPILKMQFRPVIRGESPDLTAAAIERLTFGGLKCHRLVFVNGHWVPALSGVGMLPSDARVESLAAAIKNRSDLLYPHLCKYIRGDENGFTALNTGFMQDGAFVYVPDGAVIDDPIHLMFVAAGDDGSFVSTPRNLILAGRNSRVSIVESYVSLTDLPYLTSSVTEMVAGEHAVIEHDKFQDESLNAFHVGTTHFQQGAGSNVVSNSITIGGAIARNNVTAVLAAPGI